MVDSSEKPDSAVPELDKTVLLNRIDELEKLLAEKKAATEKQTPRLKVGTDGIPVLVDAVTEEELDPPVGNSLHALKQDNEIINDIINKVDKEISQDLDELIVLLKDSIIDEVKTRLLKELQINENKTENDQTSK